MANKKKGKQKQDEPPNNSQKQSSTVEEVNVRVPDDKPNVSSSAEAQGNDWGETAPDPWDVPDTGHQGEAWRTQDTETWGTAEGLLQPPSTQSHNDTLPTIHGQPSSGNFTQNRLSEIEESPEEYEQSWHNSDANSRHSESQSVTATAPSPPVVPPAPSTLEEAMKAVLKQGTSTASEAARKMEKERVKAVQFREPVISAKVEKSNPQVAFHQGLSSASAAAAESSRKQTQAPNPGQRASIFTTIPWTYLKPGTRHPPPMPIDPSWISTGGNAWSNKHRNGFQNPSWSPDNEHLRTQFQHPQFQQHAQHAQQVRQPHHTQRPQTHQRHHSHPAQAERRHPQSSRPLYKVRTQERQDWQDWGGRDHSTESENDDDTATGWETSNQHESDQWGQSRGGENQNTTGGEWAQNGWGAGERQNQNAAGGREKNAGEGRGQHTGGGWNQGAAEGWGQSAAEDLGEQGTGDRWRQSAGGWTQEPTNPKKDDRTRKPHPKGGDGWGQGHQISGQKGQKQGSTEENGAWGQNRQEPTDTWGQDTGDWAARGGDSWDQGASTWDQNTNHRADAWNQGVSTWDQDAGDIRRMAGEWATGGGSSNVAWGDEAQRLPKVTAAAPSEAVGNRNVLSAQQRSQILSNLLNQTQTQNVKVAQSAIKHGAQKKIEHEQWGAWEALDHGWGSEDEDDMDDTRRVRFSPKASQLWGESPRSIPSKTLAHAQQGMTTTPVNDPSNVRFLESKGAAFEYVTNAFFGNSRLARERIHWLFPSEKDPRVATMLAWVQKLSYNLGTFGLIKFLQHRERGGLFINSIFRMRHNPGEPALDWLTFNEVQGTMDKTLQESVAFYDPSVQVMVFVYLPSESGNSVAIWRLKINVPDKTKSKYHAEINAIAKTLRKHTEYIVCVDERPPKKKPVRKTTLLRKSGVKSTKRLPAQPKVKRKWWQFFL